MQRPIAPDWDIKWKRTSLSTAVKRNMWLFQYNFDIIRCDSILLTQIQDSGTIMYLLMILSIFPWVQSMSRQPFQHFLAITWRNADDAAIGLMTVPANCGANLCKNKPMIRLAAHFTYYPVSGLWAWICNMWNDRTVICPWGNLWCYKQHTKPPTSNEQ